MEFGTIVNTIKTFLGTNTFKNFDITYEQSDKQNGFSIRKNGKSINITYKDKSDLFRALTYVKQNKDKVNYEINLSPKFDTNGLMIDCSRNGVIKVSELKNIILVMASMGLNRLLLYTEDTYELDGYPYFGYLRGAYSKEDLKELAKYGDSFGVTLVPCIQTLDHLAKPLRWEIFENIKDGPSNLLVNNDETYKFIEAMFKVSRECFISKEIHIGMDESFSLGLGKYLNKNGYHNRVELFCEHLDKVIKIAEKYDFSPMIWSDMFFRLNDEKQEYYSGNKLPQSTLKLIPEGVGLVYWDYYHDDINVYDNMFKSHLETKREVYFAGGSWRWSGFAPSLHKSYEYTELALQSAKNNNIKNVFVTAWGDDGNECSIYTTLLSLAQYSVANYQDHYSKEDVNSLLEAVTGETMDNMLLLDLPNMPNEKVLAPTYNPSKFLFYQDPMLGMFDNQVKPNFVINYAKYVKTLQNAAKNSPNYSYVYENLSNLCDFLSLKADLGVKLRKAYKENDLKGLEELANKVIPEAIKRLDRFHKTLLYQWQKENRMFGFDVLDGRIGYLKQRLETTAFVINSYLDKKISKIEELEKEILDFNGHDYEVSWNWWALNVAI